MDDRLLNLSLGIVEMGREPDAATPARADDMSPHEFLVEYFLITPLGANSDDAGLSVGFSRRDQLQTGYIIDPVDQDCPVFDDPLRDTLDPDLLDQAQAGIQGVDPQHIRATAFESGAVLGGRPLRSIEVPGTLDHVPAELGEIQLGPDPVARVEQGDPLGAHHPLMPIRHDEISVGACNIERERPKALYGIHAEEYPSLAAERTQQLQIDTGAIRVLHRAA